MSGFQISVEDAGVLAALRRVASVLADPTPLTNEIAALGESSTRQRFRTETGPDGTAWKQSLRAKLTGGRTLTQDGHLSGSLSSRHGRTFAEWGVNRIYAAIHQFGGVIRPVNAKALRFQLADGSFAVRKSVTMPARPYLGLSDDDVGDILDAIERALAPAAA